MKLLIFLTIVAFASAGRLQNVYLPPLGAGSAAGQGLIAAPVGPVAPVIPIVKQENDNTGDGTYRFSFETGNHIVQQESGQLKGADSSAVQGSYSYVGSDGQTYSVQYVADENGFRADGSHLPTPPPVPQEILKSLQQNAADEAAGIIDDGQYRPAVHGGSGGQLTGGHISTQYQPPQQGGYRY